MFINCVYFYILYSDKHSVYYTYLGGTTAKWHHSLFNNTVERSISRTLIYNNIKYSMIMSVRRRGAFAPPKCPRPGKIEKIHEKDKINKITLNKIYIFTLIAPPPLENKNLKKITWKIQNE